MGWRKQPTTFASRRMVFRERLWRNWAVILVGSIFCIKAVVQGYLAYTMLGSACKTSLFQRQVAWIMGLACFEIAVCISGMLAMCYSPEATQTVYTMLTDGI